MATDREPHRSWQLRLGAERDAAPAALLEELDRGLDVQVPCSVLGALVAAGLAPDVTVDATEEEVAWAAACSWVLSTSVPREGTGRLTRLVFEGVDTVATVSVDGRVAAHTDDMFHRWVVELGPDDAEGPQGRDTWDVEIAFAPVEPLVRAAEAADPLPRADMYELPYNQLRKMACSFGWDWGPTTMTTGLWRDVTVERLGAGRLDEVLLDATWDGAARLEGVVEVSGDVDHLVVRVSDPGGEGRSVSPLVERDVTVVGGRATLAMPVEAAHRWNPVHRGTQPLFDVEVVAVAGDGTILDTARRRVGFRHVEVRQEEDALGRTFDIVINGERLWARGFNWIPAHPMPEEVTPTRVRMLVERAVATGATMLRVWGGGVIESDDFYDVCDELGVTVWQDFSFACAAYAEDDEQAARVRREVADAVRRVGHHPSLVVWCGGNECLWGHEDWGWKEQLAGRGWGARLYHDVIPEVLAEVDPARPYVPGSPFSPSPEDHPNDVGSGTTHHWETWNELDLVAFRDTRTRFAAEFGWQAPPPWPALTTAVGGAPTGGDDPRLVRLQKAWKGAESLARGIATNAPDLPGDGRSWYLAGQVVQARALRTAIAHYRSLHDDCSGALWWQLNDCWPGMSWSVVGVNGRPKLSWWAAREVMAPRAVLPAAPDASDGLTLVNDLAAPWETTVCVSVIAADGDVASREERPVVVNADSHVVVRPREVAADALAVTVEADGTRAVRWLQPVPTSPDPVRVELSVDRQASDRVLLGFVAQAVIADLVVQVELDPRTADVNVDHQLLVLLPGETATMTVTGAGVADVDDVVWRDLVGAGRPLHVTGG